MKFLKMLGNLKILQFLAYSSLILLLLSACSQQKQTKSASAPEIVKSKPNKSDSETKSAPIKRKAIDSSINPKKTATVIAVYAAKKYGGDWQKTLTEEKENGFAVAVKNSEYFPHVPSSFGVVYQVGDHEVLYTLKQVGQDNVVYLYTNNGMKELGQTTFRTMIQYLKENDWDYLISKYVRKTKIFDLRISPKLMSQKMQGDAGSFIMPLAMRGNWYSYFNKHMNTTTIGLNYTIDNGEKYELHRIDDKFFEHKTYGEMSKNYQIRTENWKMTGEMNRKIHGIRWINFRAWMQGAGDGIFLGLHSEMGQPVLVAASGASIATDQIYWKTPQLALQNKNKEFSDLYYIK
ncbi:hypothetical protein H3U50_06030 [Lactobacillus sp. M0398]|uniref:hypothetical protein n=1 Tax=unclassified Lactobacillus TaxID=2620435 RepID=UPI0018DC071A|nr:MULTISPECIES: hypothetical protein [unclassified Lactobacillus]MBI0121381.1 hypothetical protein [Lactobacillus sp. M0398]MBI0123528.1 hypothetical protein [Lactobacillus sp. W8174]MBI0135842.1 hypothetical protein [Lactobacillus sp. W8173]